MYGPVPVSDQPGVCQNCAREDDDLESVRRLYVVPESWDQAGSVTMAEDVELWCFSCRTQYPHEEVGGEAASG